MKVGTILYTKDGRRIGNAIVTEILDNPFSWVYYYVKTDFGNLLLLRADEVFSLFYVSDKVQNVDRWLGAKVSLILSE